MLSYHLTYKDLNGNDVSSIVHVEDDFPKEDIIFDVFCRYYEKTLGKFIEWELKPEDMPDIDDDDADFSDFRSYPVDASELVGQTLLDFQAMQFSAVLTNDPIRVPKVSKTPSKKKKSFMDL